jgi:DNA-binding transcriptional ArsR family regulator
MRLALEKSLFALKTKYPMHARDGQNELPDISRASWKGRLELDAGGAGSVDRKVCRWDRKNGLTLFLYFCNYRNMKKPDPLLVTRSADRFAALGAEPRLAILRLLLSAHPGGLIAGEVQEELDIPASTLSHHLEKLKQVGLVNVQREGTFLWYSANTDALREVLGFLYEECCTRSRAVAPESFVQISR